MLYIYCILVFYYFLYILDCYIFLAYTAAIFVKLWSELSEKVLVSGVVLLLSYFTYFYCLMLVFHKS